MNRHCGGKGNLLTPARCRRSTGIFIDKIKGTGRPGTGAAPECPLGGSMMRAQEDLDCLQAWPTGSRHSVGP